MRFWHTLLIPVRVLFRITEYLAGPPVYEELSTLQQAEENWRNLATALEVERDELQHHLAAAQVQRDQLAQQANTSKKQRDELNERVVRLEKEHLALKDEALRLTTDRNQWKLQAATDYSKNAEAISSILQTEIPSGLLDEKRLSHPHPGDIDSLDPVVFNVTVLGNDGRPVAGLMQNQFQVVEDDEKQTIQTFLLENTPATIGVLIDSSGSMMGKRADVIAAGSAFIAASNPHDEMFVVTFNRNACLALPSSQPFTSDRFQLRATLTQIRTEGTTALYDALKLALNHLEKSARQRKAIVVLSDGGDNASVTKFEEVLRLVQQSSATIFCIGIYDPAQRDRDPVTLRTIADITGGEAYFPDTLAALHSVWPRIAATIREQYTIGYTPRNAAKDGKYRKIRVTVEDKSGQLLRVRLRPGYLEREIVRS